MKNKNLSKCILGTVQLGMDYGIANKDGQPSKDESISILQYATENSINTFDTAPGYGTSENLIGEFISKHSDQIYTFTKLQSIKGKEVKGYAKKSLESSLKSLNQNKVEGLFVHNLEDFNKFEFQITKQLQELKSLNLVNMLGVSVYDDKDIENIIQKNWVDMVQIPFNIFDLRLYQNGRLDELHDLGVGIFARSVFLQGLFFLNPNELPEKIKEAKIPLQKLSDIAKSEKLSIEEMALLFVRDNKLIDHFLIGVENIRQLRSNVKILSKPSLSAALISEIYDLFVNLPPKILDPRIW